MKPFEKIFKKSVKIKNKRKNVIEKRTNLFITYLFCSNATKTKRNLTSADLTENKKKEKGKKKATKNSSNGIIHQLNWAKPR